MCDDDQDGICAICQGSLNDGPTFTIPTCHHEFHTACLFENYCHGNISCAICRTLPITNLNVDNTLDNIARSYDDINQRDEERFFRKDPTEKTFKCPFKSPSSVVKSIIAFATSKKKSERRRTASHTERGVINRYSNGIGVASSSIGRKSGSSSQQSVPSRTIAKKSCR